MLGGLGIVRDDAVGVLRAVARDVIDRVIDAVDHFYSDDRIEIFGRPVGLGGGFHALVDAQHFVIATYLAAGIQQGVHQWPQMRFDAGAVDQQRLGRAAHAGAPQLGVERDFSRHVEIGGTINVHMVDAFQMREHRHARVRLHTRDQALAAARHDHVNAAVEPGQHQAHRLAIGDRHQLNGGLGQTRRLQPARQAFGDGAARCQTVRAAAQDHGVARLEAQTARIRGHVRPAFVDDADDAQRHPHARNVEPVWPRPVRNHGADRIGQVGDFLQTLGHGLDALGIQRQAIDERRRPAGRLRRRQILRVGIDDLIDRPAQESRRRAQRVVLRVCGRLRQLARGLAGSLADAAHDRGGALVLVQSAHVIHIDLRSSFHVPGPPAVITISSRWTMSARPSKPRMAAISRDLRPMIRRASSCV